jgi:hypothetical protein
MPRFFFHLLGEASVKDSTGQELPGPGHAVQHGLDVANLLRSKHPAEELYGKMLQVVDDRENEIAIVPLGQRRTIH